MNIDLLSAVLGAYGFVKKLVTFTKPGGTAMVAWVQFPDAQIATSVRDPTPARPPARPPASQRASRRRRHSGGCFHSAPRPPLLSMASLVRCVTIFPPTHPHMQVKASLQGLPIPRHLLKDHPAPPVLEATFAAVPELQIRTQSYCTR